MRTFFVVFAVLLVGCAAFSGAALGQTPNVFDDDFGDHRWNQETNWSLNDVPDETHNAIIPDGLTCVIDYTDAVCSRFTLIDDAVLELDASAKLTVDETHGTSIEAGCKVVLGRSAALDFNGGGVITLDGTIEDVNSGEPDDPAQIGLRDDRTYVVRGGGGFVGNVLLHISHGPGWNETLVLSPGTGIYGTVLVRPALINQGTVNPDNTFSQDEQVDDVINLVCRPKIGSGTWRADCTDCIPDITTPNRLVLKTPVLGTGNLEITEFSAVIADGLARVISLFGDFEISGGGAYLKVESGVVFEVDRYEKLNCP